MVLDSPLPEGWKKVEDKGKTMYIDSSGNKTTSALTFKIESKIEGRKKIL